MIEINITKIGEGFVPATIYDKEILDKSKINWHAKAKIVNTTTRSYQHHKLFFGGLLPLAFEYWEPQEALFREGEIESIEYVSKFISEATKFNVFDLAKKALSKLARLRANKLEPPKKDIESFREWLTIEAGFFEYHATPKGYKKIAQSISFSNMNQDEFNKFYNACFNVCWNMILSNTFKTKEEAENAVNQLMSMS